MPLLRLFLKPGIDKQNTEYGAEGGWTEFGGTSPNFLGLASEVFTWNDLSGAPYAAVGTNRKLYVFMAVPGQTLPRFVPQRLREMSRLQRSMAHRSLRSLTQVTGPLKAILLNLAELTLVA